MFRACIHERPQSNPSPLEAHFRACLSSDSNRERSWALESAIGLQAYLRLRAKSPKVLEAQVDAGRLRHRPERAGLPAAIESPHFRFEAGALLALVVQAASSI